MGLAMGEAFYAPSGRYREFADSPLEGDGFELLVPRCAPITDRAALVARLAR